MNVAEVLKIADGLVFSVRNKHLNDLEKSIVEGVSEGKTSSQIANETRNPPYTEAHINEIAAKLWKDLSAVLGEEVKKSNFKSTIERYHLSIKSSTGFVQQINPFNVCSDITIHNQSDRNLSFINQSNNLQYLKTIPALIPICGRTEEIKSLNQLILTNQCRSIVIYGSSGIGKTALIRQLLEEIKNEFDEIVWESFGCQRAVVEFIDRSLIASLNINQSLENPLDLESRLSLLLEYFREHRCLIILDDVDQLFSSGELAGNYTEEYREYRELFRRIWETNHQSCVLLLSQEEPSELAVMLGNNSSIHSLPLGGLGEGGREIFRAKGLSDEDQWDDTIDYLGGNPAYLESVSIAINKLFGGKVAEFCKYEELFLTEDIKSMLSQQFIRLSVSEQVVIKFLASENVPITIARSIESLSLSPGDVGNSIVSLVRRGLVDRTETKDGAFFGLRSIIKQFTFQL
jgi:hypothetical protein